MTRRLLNVVMICALQSSSLVLLFSSLTVAAPLLVPQEYATIQSAIDASQENDTVLVAPGSYTENLRIWNSKAIVLMSSGGASQTILRPAHGDASTIKPMGSNLTNPVIIDGFSIQDMVGGGRRAIFIYNRYAIIQNCIIQNNKNTNVGNQDPFGAGIFCAGGVVIIRNNVIAGNECPSHGAGIWAENNYSLEIYENVIFDNYSPVGPGICFGTYPSNARVERNIIYDNVGEGDDGHALWVNLGNVYIVNNTIVGNTHGVKISQEVSGTFSNNIVAHNEIDGLIAGGATPSFNLFWENGGITDVGVNGLAADPQFINLSTWNLRLDCSSPCIDAGDPSAPQLVGRRDLGAYEFEYIRGNADGRFGRSAITLSDVTFLVRHVFEQGLAPCPVAAADADCNGSIALPDIMIILDYLFGLGEIACP